MDGVDDAFVEGIDKLLGGDGGRRHRHCCCFVVVVVGWLLVALMAGTPKIWRELQRYGGNSRDMAGTPEIGGGGAR